MNLIKFRKSIFVNWILGSDILVESRVIKLWLSAAQRWMAIVQVSSFITFQMVLNICALKFIIKLVI